MRRVGAGLHVEGEELRLAAQGHHLALLNRHRLLVFSPDTSGKLV